MTLRAFSLKISICSTSVISIDLHIFGGNKLANIKSAKKRILVTAIRTERNKATRTRVKTAIKKVENAVNEGNKEVAAVALKEASGQIHKAARKGIYHKNNAARKISRLSKMVNQIA